MKNKKIIIPSDEEVQIYTNKKSIKKLAPNPFDAIEIKDIKKEIKNRGNFCSTTKVYYSWKDMVKSIIDNTDYGNDKR